MIEMGMLFKNIIPLDLLGQMPLSFVHRLRDLRIQQLEEQRKQQEMSTKQGIPAIPPSAIDDIMDELS